MENIFQLYSPILYFHRSEASFPISSEKYISACRILDSKGEILDENPTSKSIYEYKQAGLDSLQLQFKSPHWKDELAGNPGETVGYSRILRFENRILLVYFFLFSHTEPYRFCGCGPPLTVGAHRADLKFIAVELALDLSPTRVYFGAHGTKAGVWKPYSEVEKVGTNIVAYSALGDHSFYPEGRDHPRIFFIAWDKCEKGVESRPWIVRIDGDEEGEFSPEKDGWCYLPGNMNEDGIAAPWRQNFWNGNIPEVSNSPWKRLFCPDYF